MVHVGTTNYELKVRKPEILNIVKELRIRKLGGNLLVQRTVAVVTSTFFSKLRMTCGQLQLCVLTVILCAYEASVLLINTRSST